MRYNVAVGLEIHAELLTKTKLFCGCENSFGGESNSRCCPVCVGFPGAVGVLSKEALFLSVKAGLMTDCEVHLYSAFDRKNYFYPDNPKAYQITQQRFPLCTDGYMDVDGKRIRIDNIHLEEDAGKMLHRGNMSFVDYNRCGVPLIEIVTGPDINNAQDAVRFVEELSLRLQYADVCDGRMDRGSLRVDVNVSVAPETSNKPGTRVEIKNLASLKSVKKAIEYEIERQTEVLDKGESVLFETRRFDEDLNKTFSMRSKERAHDYRYFPEPDIPPVLLTDAEVENISMSLPERPDVRYKKYIQEFGLADDEARIITADRNMSDFYESVCACGSPYKKTATLILAGLGRLFNEYGGDFNGLKFSPFELSCLGIMWQNEEVSSQSAMSILEILFLKGGSAKDIAEKNGLIISFDSLAAEKAADCIIAENMSAVKDYKDGKNKAFGYLMGKVMSRLAKNTNPAKVKEILEKKLRHM